VNGGGTYCASATLTATGGTGGTIYWQGTTSGGVSTATASTIQNVTASGTYYFRAYNSCSWGDEGSATVTINNVPGAVTVNGGGFICDGNSLTLTATGGANGTIYWQGTTSDGTSTDSPSTSEVVTSTGLYYFRAYNDCGWGQQGSTLVIVNSLPSDFSPNATPSVICSGSSSTLSASVSNAIIYWYTGSCGGTLIGTGNTRVVSPTTTTTYYARAYNATSGCWSNDCGAVTVSMASTPDIITINGGGTYCNSATITATGGTGGTIYWQGTSSDGTSTLTPSTIQTVTASGTYYFRTWNSCTWGPEANVSVTVNYVPGAVTVSGGGSICYGSTLTLTASGGTNGTIYWQGTTSGGTSTDTPSVSEVVSSTGIYYFRAYNDCSWGVQGSVLVIVNQLPNDPTPIASPADICIGGSSTLSASVSGSTVYWYEGSCGNNQIGSGNTITVTPAVTTTYYARAYSALTGCWAENCGSVTVTVSSPIAQTISGANTLCVGSTTTWTSTTIGGFWSSNNPAVAMIDPSIGLVAGISAGSSLITYSVNVGGCVNTATQTITITSSIAQTISGTTPLCIGSSSTWTGTTSGGSWVSDNPGIATVDIATGSVTGVAQGTALITYSVTTSGGCVNTATKTVSIWGNIGINVSGGASPICYNSNPGTFTATATGGDGSYTYQWYSSPSAIINDATNSTYNPDNLVSDTGYYCSVTGNCGTAVSNTVSITVYPSLTATLSGGNSPICDKTNPGVFTATATGGTGSYTYQWYKTSSGLVNNATNSTYTPGLMAANNGFYCVVTSSPCGSATTQTFNVVVIPEVSTPTPITDSLGTEPACQLLNGTTITDYNTTATNNLGFHWSINNPAAGSIDSVTGVMTWANGFYGTVDIQVFAYGCPLTSPQITRTVVVNQRPFAEAGTKATYSGVPVSIGDPNNGPGSISWLPVTGLNNPSSAQPLASPTTTTTYTLTVNSNGCISTDTVTIVVGTHIISGKTRYAGRASVGNPVPNYPTYNSPIYDIDNVIVILKTYPGGIEVSRDTSDATGNYQLNNVFDGNYIISYDKYTADTMMWCNGVDAIDLTLLKYNTGVDTLVDPSRNFSTKYLKAANVDNFLWINAIDISRIRAKIGSPYFPAKNFPKGNWVALDTMITMAGSDMNITLQTICYGDYNASSSRYRDSLWTWSLAKSIPENIISVSDDYITTNDPSYFEVPLRISTKVKDLSAVGLELNYPDQNFKLVNVTMPKAGNKQGNVKINPSLDEIIADNNDLLVTDENGVIRIVFATTNDFDVDASDEIVKLGFRSLSDLKSGDIGFELSGTGVIGNKYGEENEDAYLIMPKIFVQSDDVEAGFDFAGYPNPFGGDANLTYSLPENGSVKLNVYNAIGELVTTLVNEDQTSGKHTVTFSPKNLPAGMYTFRLEFAGVDKSKCLVLKMLH